MHQTEVADDTVPYRASHQGADKAADYDHDFWTFGSAKAQNWVVERRLLDRAFGEVLPAPPRRAVDFACGTGRVLAELESRVPETYGIDVSSDMLALARDRCPRSRLICRDVTRSDAPLDLGGPVDVVTAFRFFLNAEPALRRAALAWIRENLSAQGRLVANFHLNPYSLRGTYLRLRLLRHARMPMLSQRDITRLLAESGFVVEDVQGYEYLPYRRDGAHLLAPQVRTSIEDALCRRQLLRGLAGCHLVVARPA
jgi:SAM-dependent methyltransferase